MQLPVRPHWEQNLAYQTVRKALRSAGFQCWAVGGCVRDALLARQAKDVDVATNARPHDLPKIFGTKPWDGDSDRRESPEGVVLYPTGVRHGTWTVRVGDDEVEVTTFRKDVDTDGRNATVEFADTLEEDAMRRDFTMNALYYDQNVGVADPTGWGVIDALRGHVQFVGDAAERVQEDYLRILRLFRFHARFGKGPMNVEAWNAASKYRFGLSQHVSGERIWDETKKLLSMHDPFEACAQMDATMVAGDLFPDWNVTALGDLLWNERKANCAPRWERRYVALVGNEIPFPHANSEQKAVDKLFKNLYDVFSTQAIVAHECGEVTAYDWAVLKGARPNHREITRGVEAVFPVSSDDVMERGFKPGPLLGQELRDLKEAWLESDLTLSREDLLNKIGWSDK